MWYLWLSLLVSYAFLSWYSLVLSASPTAHCYPGRPCYGPLITTGQMVTMELWLFRESDDEIKKFDWFPVTSCRFNVTLPESGTLPKLLTANDTKCEIPLPSSARRRSPHKNLVQPLKARFTFSIDGTTALIGNVPFEITRIVERRPRGLWVATTGNQDMVARNLLDQPILPQNVTSKKDVIETPTWVPFLKYGKAAVRIRFVAEDRQYGTLERADGMQLQPWNHNTYAPMIYVDDLSLQRSAQVELAPPEDGKPPIQLQIKVSSLSPVLDSLNRQAHAAFDAMETMLPGDELDEIRYFLQDERLYRFVITQIISYVHLTFDYLAFRDEIRFYRGRKNLSGVSTSTAITRLVCSLIILLYLLDGGGTSWVVLVSMFSSCSVDAWKVWKLLRPEWKRSFPFFAIRQLQSGKEQETNEYDRIAFKNLAMILYPLVIGWSLYALQHYEYRSWYSWLISNLANAVYTFGFISLCPQLYVNYRLKSVAHLPWKVFMYKIFNTFVDDAFAWLIEMPWKHRIMTLRDDVVFLLFLVQVYLYRVDKSRLNEFGYSYDHDGDETALIQQDEANCEDTQTKSKEESIKEKQS